MSLGRLFFPIFGFIFGLLITGLGIGLFAFFSWHGQTLYSWTLQLPVLGDLLNGFASLTSIILAPADSPGLVLQIHDAIRGMLAVSVSLFALALALWLINNILSALSVGCCAYLKRRACKSEEIL